MVEACTAYIDGVSDAASFYQFLRPMDGSKGQRLPDYVCVPGPTTGPQLREDRRRVGSAASRGDCAERRR